MTLHYSSDGNVFLRILHRKQEFLLPIILVIKSLIDLSDVQIYNRLVQGHTENSIISDRVEVMLRGGKAMNLTSREQCLAYIGRHFRIVLNITNPEVNDKEVGEIFLNENILVHLSDSSDKFNFLCLMIQKLYALVSDQVLPDNLDSLINQEVLLPGHLYLMFLREKLEETLQSLRARILKDGFKEKDAKRTVDINFIKKAIEQ